MSSVGAGTGPFVYSSEMYKCVYGITIISRCKSILVTRLLLGSPWPNHPTAHNHYHPAVHKVYMHVINTSNRYVLLPSLSIHLGKVLDCQLDLFDKTQLDLRDAPLPFAIGLREYPLNISLSLASKGQSKAYPWKCSCVNCVAF